MTEDEGIIFCVDIRHRSMDVDRHREVHDHSAALTALALDYEGDDDDELDRLWDRALAATIGRQDTPEGRAYAQEQSRQHHVYLSTQDEAVEEAWRAEQWANFPECERASLSEAIGSGTPTWKWAPGFYKRQLERNGRGRSLEQWREIISTLVAES